MKTEAVAKNGQSKDIGNIGHVIHCLYFIYDDHVKKCNIVKYIKIFIYHIAFEGSGSKFETQHKYESSRLSRNTTLIQMAAMLTFSILTCTRQHKTNCTKI